MSESKFCSQPQGYNVGELFSSFSFEVPIYQRVFTWEEEQFERLFKDLKEHFSSSERNERYYLGVVTVVRQEKGERLILIDGQQRLTCILLLGAMLHWNLDPSKLSYAARPTDKKALEEVYSICRECDSISNEDIARVKNTAMAGFLRFALTKEMPGGPTWLTVLRQVSETIKRRLTLLVSFLPEEPYQKDIFEQNRYFEKMNNGGKQLEPHEILKVQMCKGLDASSVKKWNAVADFGRCLEIAKEGDIASSDGQLPLSAVIDDKCPQSETDNYSLLARVYKRCGDKNQLQQYEHGTEERDDLRRGLISFPTFLLHVRFWFLTKCMEEKEVQIGDESRLLDLFQELTALPPKRREEFIDKMKEYREFLDNEIIHMISAEGESRYAFYTRDPDGSIRDAMPDDDEKKALLQFQSMLYASSGYDQKWLLDAYGDYCKKPESFGLDCLKLLLKKDGGMLDDEVKVTILKSKEWPDDSFLSYGTENRRWLALLDYLLWERFCRKDKELLQWLECPKFDSYKDIISSAIRNYVFRRNRSVEHLHAQTDDNATTPEEWEVNKNIFGNLALISSGKNSEYGNLSVGGKFDRVVKLLGEGGGRGSKIESIKLLFMLARCNGEESKWKPEEARSHANDMLKLYRDFLSCGCCLGERGNVNAPLSSREDLLRWIVDELDHYMLERGFSRAKGSKLSDSVIDDKSLYYEKDGVRVVFSTEKENCASMYVGILNEYAGGWDALARVKGKLPNWEQYRTWCWHYLDEGRANWTDEFLKACKSNRTNFVALLDEIATLIQEAYVAMKQVKNELSRT